MNDNRTQDTQLTRSQILELAEKMLNLTEQMDNLANQMLKLAIPAESEEGGVDGVWTIEMFEALVPELLRKRYEEQNRDGELYRLGAELKNFFREQRWELPQEFSVKHIFFSSENRRLFGINLFSSRPRLTFCRVTEEEVRFFAPEYSFTPYPQYSQFVCHRGPTVEDLRALYEFIYNNNLSQS